MDVPTFFKEYDRMCKYYKIEWDCGSCPLVTEITDLQGSCLEQCKRDPEKSEAIVEQWAKEHPEKTYKSVFLEKFPDAKIEKNGVPYPCIIYLFGEKVRPRACGNCSCTYCWDREVEE